MRFRVPQFLDVKSKLFGPLSLSEFLYLAGGGGICILLYVFIPWFWLSLILMLPVAGLSLALAFYEVNDRPFIEVLEAAFYYVIGTRMYVWKRRRQRRTQQTVTDQEEEETPTAELPDISKGRLKDMTWSLDVAAGAEKADEDESQTKESGEDTEQTDA